jgi:formylmethanofuran dehydrogenase subunit A
LIIALLQAGASQQASALIARDPASQARLDYPTAVAYLLNALMRAGADQQAAALAARAADHVSVDNPYSLTELLRAVQEVGAAGRLRSVTTNDR